MVYKRIIPEHEGLRQEDPEFKANLGYRVRQSIEPSKCTSQRELHPSLQRLGTVFSPDLVSKHKPEKVERWCVLSWQPALGR